MTGMYTFVLNLKDASSSTYQTWVTIRVRDGLLERKSNEGGNGQTWVPFGYGSGTELKLFCDANGKHKHKPERIVSHVVRSVGVRCNVGGFGAAWGNATVTEATVNRKTGRKLTAAPSIRDGKPDRDKNANQMRAKVAKIDMAAAMAARNAKETKDVSCQEFDAKVAKVEAIAFQRYLDRVTRKRDTVIRIDPVTLRVS